VLVAYPRLAVVDLLKLFVQLFPEYLIVCSVFIIISAGCNYFFNFLLALRVFMMVYFSAFLDFLKLFCA